MTIQFANLDAEAKELARIRQLRRTMWIVWLSGVPIIGIVVSLLKLPELIGPLVLIWGGAFTVTVLRVIATRCPRCGDRYHMPGPLTGGIFSQRCKKCGLGLRGEADA